MKKLIALLTLITICATLLCSCAFINSLIKGEPEQLSIGYLAGPTGMGIAKLIHDNGGEGGNEKYSFTKYADSNAAKADLAAGKIDIICLPTNDAAMFYNTVDNSSKVLAVNCLNSLYLLTKGSEKVSSLSDLEGQTIFTCKNGTPRMVLEYIIKTAGINATISYEFEGKEILTPQELSAYVVSGKLPNAVMPEPLVTSSLLQITKNGDNNITYTVDVNLASEWENVSDTPVTMGCIVANGSAVNEKKDEIDAFLDEYKASIEYIGNPDNLDSAAEFVVENGIMGAVPAAKKALTNLNGAISYIDSEDMKEALEAFYTAIGIKLPGDDFYYER
ncbi:MAG: ABC transporter substrate-binding protein [Clostridia bacterium]|nr:ABC transporter substrate-binding protein [Clostridia bacterium]